MKSRKDECKKEGFLLFDFLYALKRGIGRGFYYILYIFRPAKKLTPDGKKKIKEITADDHDANSFSPVFVNTKDAIDWLNS